MLITLVALWALVCAVALYHLKRTQVQFHMLSEHGFSQHPNYDPKFNCRPYHCVEVKARPDCCQGIKRLLGKRILAREAPPLPLTKRCQSDPKRPCQCHYQHFSDRRQGQRRTHLGLMHELHGKQGNPERRDLDNPGRRKTDYL